jgi:hypothetical protein
MNEEQAIRDPEQIRQDCARKHSDSLPEGSKDGDGSGADAK